MVAKKLLLAALLVSSTAYAQENVQDENRRQPVDGIESPEAAHDGKAVPGDSASASGPGSEHHPGDHDPSRHFNFATHWFDYKKYDEYGGKFGDGEMRDKNGNVVMEVDEATGKLKPAEEEPMSAPFLFMLLNFGLLLVILGKYGGPVARGIAQERHDTIKTALDEAARLRDQAQQKLTEYETRIKDVDAEVKKLVDGIRADAEADKKRILEAASLQAAQMKRDAEARIAAEIELARHQLTKEVTAAAAGATEKLLRDKLTTDDQNKLVNTFIANVSSTRPEAR
jgi:F-type H+-transporting ATPase subunit b